MMKEQQTVPSQFLIILPPSFCQSPCCQVLIRSVSIPLSSIATVGETKGHLMSEAEATPSPAPVSPEALKLALKAFKKRLKATRLDDESRMGYGPMSGGGKSSIDAIIPPSQYPTSVWQELARQGKLKYATQGFYELGAP